MCSFRKGQKMLNYIFKFFDWVDFTFIGWFRRIWKCVPQQCLFIFSLLTIIAVFFYSDIEFVFSFNEVPKLSGSGFYNGYRLVRIWETIFHPTRGE